MYHCKHFGLDSLSRDMFPIKFCENINEELVKVEYLSNFSQYFENFTKAITGSYNKTFVRKISKSFSFMCQQNLIETLYVPVVFMFPNRKFKPKCLQW